MHKIMTDDGKQYFAKSTYFSASKGYIVESVNRVLSVMQRLFGLVTIIGKMMGYGPVGVTSISPIGKLNDYDIFLWVYIKTLPS